MALKGFPLKYGLKFFHLGAIYFATFGDAEARNVVGTLLSVDGFYVRVKIPVQYLLFSQQLDNVQHKLSQRLDTVQQKLSQQLDTVQQKLSQRLDTVQQKLSQQIKHCSAKTFSNFYCIFFDYILPLKSA